jgi:hypothetical protein
VRTQRARSEKAEGTITEIASDFEKLWRQYTGFLDDTHSPDEPAQAALAERLRASHEAALAKLAAWRQAELTRQPRAAAPQ